MGADEMTLEAIAKSLLSRGFSEEEIEKSFNNTAGLLAKKKEIMVNGKPVFKTYWVNPKNEALEKDKQQREIKIDEQKNAPKDTKQEDEDYEKPTREKKSEDDDLPDDIKSHIGGAHSAKAGKKPLAVVLHDKNAHKAVDSQFSGHGVKAAGIDPKKLGKHTDKAIKHAADNKKHIVYDASESHPDDHKKVAQKLEKHGFDVHEIGKKK